MMILNSLNSFQFYRIKIKGHLSTGVGNDFFPGGLQGGGFGPRAQRGIRGVDFWTQKLTNFDQNSNFCLFQA